MSEDKIGIDKQQNKKYDPEFPTPGVNQSSQPWRDNWSVIKTSIENLQRKQVFMTGDLSGISNNFNAGTDNVEINVQLTETGVIPGTYAFPTITVDKKGRITDIQTDENILKSTTSHAFYRDLTGVWNLDYGSINPVPSVYNDIEAVRFWPKFDQSIYHTMTIGHDFDPTKPTLFETTWVVPEVSDCSDAIDFPSTSVIEVGLEWKINNGSWLGSDGKNIPDLKTNIDVETDGIQKVSWTIPKNTFHPCDVVQFRLSRFAARIPEEENLPEPCDIPRANKIDRLQKPEDNVLTAWYGNLVFETIETRGSGSDNYDGFVDFLTANIQQITEHNCLFQKDLTSVIWNLDYGTAAIPYVREDIEVIQFLNCLDTTVYHDVMIPHNFDNTIPLVFKTVWAARAIECDKTVELGFSYKINGGPWRSSLGENTIDFYKNLNTETNQMQQVSWMIPAGELNACDILTIKIGRYAEPPSGEVDNLNDPCPSPLHPEEYPTYFGQGAGLDNYCSEIDFFGGYLYQAKN